MADFERRGVMICGRRLLQTAFGIEPRKRGPRRLRGHEAAVVEDRQAVLLGRYQAIDPDQRTAGIDRQLQRSAIGTDRERLDVLLIVDVRIRPGVYNRLKLLPKSPTLTHL